LEEDKKDLKLPKRVLAVEYRNVSNHRNKGLVIYDPETHVVSKIIITGKYAEINNRLAEELRKCILNMEL
jgi:hypothetical protein